MTTLRTLPSKVKYVAALFGVVCTAGLPATAQTPTPAPAQKINIACVGDSITAGAFVDQAVRWTTVLQTDLGPRYDVQNYGVSGTTLIKNGDSPYWKTADLTHALASKPNIVLIALGTNDSKPQNLPAHPSEFGPDLRDMISEFQSLPTHPKVWLILPPPVFDNNPANINEPVLAASIRPVIRQTAKETHCGLIDLAPTLAPHPEDSRDHVHPTPAGHKLYGDKVASVLEAAAPGGK